MPLEYRSTCSLSGPIGRVERKDRQPLRGDGARELALVVRAAPVLVDLDRPAAPLAVHRQPHDDDHVADVVFDAERGELRVVAGRLREDDRRQPEAPEAVNELKEVVPEQVLRRTRAEERRRRIEDDRLRAGLLHEVLDAVHEPEQVVVAADDGRFFERAHHLGDVDAAVGEQSAQVEAERVAGGEQIFGASPRCR